MDSIFHPRIIHAERMEDGVIIEFEDGKCAVFPASLLNATIPQANQVNENNLEGWD